MKLQYKTLIVTLALGSFQLVLGQNYQELEKLQAEYKKILSPIGKFSARAKS